MAGFGFAGFVVGVLEEGRRPYVVTIPSEETTGQGGTATVAAVPMDPRVPKIRIKTRQLAQVRLTGTARGVFVEGIPLAAAAAAAAALVVWYESLCDVWLST